MAHTFKRVVPAPVILIGLVLTAPMKSVLWTVEPMVSAWVGHVDVKKAGLDHPAIKEPATLGALNMELVKMGSVNVTKAGMASTALLRDALACVTAMEDALWTKMAGIVFVSQDGGEQDVMSPWKLYVLIARTMKEVGDAE
ncbi:hypothetical protein lerEdw1_012135 [Lerista edwardsae]|nr:hypothetical protein lerEdw1_012135 [Lerista edwardsae]